MSDTRFEIIKKRPFAASVAALMALLLGYLLLWPVPFDPVAGPPRAANPAGSGIFVKNNKLAAADMLATGIGPEAVAFDAQGRLYSSLTNGDIIRFNANGGKRAKAKPIRQPIALAAKSPHSP